MISFNLWKSGGFRKLEFIGKHQAFPWTASSLVASLETCGELSSLYWLMWEGLSTLGSFILRAKEPVLNKVGSLSCVLTCMHYACIHCLLLLTVGILSPALGDLKALISLPWCIVTSYCESKFSLVLLMLGYFVTVDKLRKGMLEKHSAPKLYSQPLEFWERALLWSLGCSWTYSLSVSVSSVMRLKVWVTYDPLGICSFKRLFEVIMFPLSNILS